MTLNDSDIRGNKKMQNLCIMHLARDETQIPKVSVFGPPLAANRTSSSVYIIGHSPMRFALLNSAETTAT